MNRFARLVTDRPVVTLLLLLLATLGVGSGLARLEMRNTQDSELPESDPIVRTNDRLEAVFGDKATVLIAVEAPDVFTPATLRKVVELSERLKSVDGVIEDEIVSLSTIGNIEGREWGLEVGPVLEEVPETPAELAALRRAVRENDLLNGKLVSEDGTLTLIAANVEEGYDQKLVHQEAFALAAELSGPEKVYVAGEAVQAEEVDSGIASDLHFLLPLVLLMTLAGFFLAFRSWRGMWLPFAVVILSVVWTMGLAGLAGLPITVVSSTVPILMVAISCSYGIHVLHHYYHESGHGSAHPARDGLARVAPAILLVAGVSAIGSLTLLTFPVTSIRQFGIIMTMGVLSTALVSLTFAPAVLALLKRRQGRAAETSARLDAALARVAHFAVSRRRAVLAATALLLVVAGIGISRIELGTDLVRYFPAEHRLRTTFNVLNEKLGGARQMSIMVEGPAADAVQDPALLRGIQGLQEYAQTLPGVGSTSSFADIVRRMHQEMNGGDPAFAAIPESRELVAQYLLLYSMSGDPGDFADLVDYDYRRAKVRMMLTTSDQGDHRRIYEALSRYAAESMGPGVKVEFGGDVMFWLAQIRHIAVGKVYNIVTGIAFVLLLCGLIFRSATAGVYSIVPLLVSTITTFGLMGYLGIRLEAATAIITSIAVGIGVDFSLHYLVSIREELRRSAGDVEKAAAQVFMTGGKPILFDMMANILGFTVLMFSRFMPIRYLGWLVSLTMVTVGITTLIVLPAMIAAWRPRFAVGGGTPAAGPPTPQQSRKAMNKAAAAVSVLLLVLAGAPRGAHAQALTGKQIIERNDQMRTVSDEKVDFEMQLINKRGQKRERKVTWVLKNDAQKNQKALLRFVTPADVRGTGLLSIENPDREDDQWLYLPALRKSRRISAADKSDSFVGSDFAFEDIGSEEIDQFGYKLLREDRHEGAPAYVVEAVPATEQKKKESGYSKREIWVRKDNFAIVRTDFYDKQGELLKVFTARDLRQVARTWRAHTMEMKNQKSGHTTVIVYGDYAINTGVSDDSFTMRELERGR